jgi:hypothetical protein
MTMSRRILVAVAAVAALATACSVAPSKVTVGTGSVESGSVTSLKADDDNYFTVGAVCNGYFGGCAAEWTATFETSWSGETSSIPLRYVGKNAGAGFQFILVFNWRTWSWYPIDAFRVVATSEVTVDKTLPGPGRDWLLKRAGEQYIGVVRVATIGNFTSTSADLLLGCAACSAGGR